MFNQIPGKYSVVEIKEDNDEGPDLDRFDSPIWIWLILGLFAILILKKERR